MDEPDLLEPEWERKNVLPAPGGPLRFDLGLRPAAGLRPAGGHRPVPSGPRQDRLYRLSAPRAVAECAPPADRFFERPYILVTPGGGGDGERWSTGCSAPTRPAPRSALSGVDRARPVHATERQDRFHDSGPPRCSDVEVITFDAHPENLMANAVGRGRHGRLQHLLRDPVLRQAGPDRAAHPFRGWSSSSAPPAPRSWDWCACWTMTARATRGRHGRPRCGTCRSSRLPSEAVPGLLNGLDGQRAGLQRRTNPAPVRLIAGQTGQGTGMAQSGPAAAGGRSW